jgi:hypothetical protein
VVCPTLLAVKIDQLPQPNNLPTHNPITRAILGKLALIQLPTVINYQSNVLRSQDHRFRTIACGRAFSDLHRLGLLTMLRVRLSTHTMSSKEKVCGAPIASREIDADWRSTGPACCPSCCLSTPRGRDSHDPPASYFVLNLYIPLGCLFPALISSDVRNNNPHSVLYIFSR